jgi:hypothetical protein
MELQANSIVWSSTGEYAVEIKREDHKTGLIATVTYKKDGPALLPVDWDLNDEFDRVMDFLKEN